MQVRSNTASAASDEQIYTSTWDALSRIVANDGIKGLYAGMNGALLGVASTNFAYFYWYTIVRTLYVKASKRTSPPSTVVELALGAIAGAIAQLFTIPVAVVTTRQQTASKEDRKGLLATAREVIDGPDGVSGLWRGLKASLVLVVNPAITYGAYERLKDVFFPGRATLKPREAFCESLISVSEFQHGPRANEQQCWAPCPKPSRQLLLSPLLWPRLVCNPSHPQPGTESRSAASLR